MRYIVQLREYSGDWADVWYTDDLARALRFAALAAATIPRVEAGRVWDTEAGAVVVDPASGVDTEDRARCEVCGAVLPLGASPYWLDEGKSVWLCEKCADPGEGEQ